MSQRQEEHDKRRVGEESSSSDRSRSGGVRKGGPGAEALLSSLFRGFVSRMQRCLWILGLGVCAKPPPPDRPWANRQTLAELRESFNPLRNRDVSSKLPPPRRFRINDNFVVYEEKKAKTRAGAPAGGLRKIKGEETPPSPRPRTQRLATPQMPQMLSLCRLRRARFSSCATRRGRRPCGEAS